MGSSPTIRVKERYIMSDRIGCLHKWSKWDEGYDASFKDENTPDGQCGPLVQSRRCKECGLRQHEKVILH